MVPQARIPRSSFNRSHGLKTTANAGTLTPILVDEVLPGDTFNCRASLFGRLATPLKPIMDNLYCDTFFFFVPYRLVWDNWQKFCGEQDSPGDSIDFTIPVRNTSSPTVGGLYDYMGLPVGKTNTTHNVLPFRAYRLIWNEWFRDQNLQVSKPVPTDDGPDDSVSYGLETRGKRHDYFTSCLPFPQKGDPVTVPLGQRAPVIVDAGIVTAGDLIAYEGNDGNSWGHQYSGTPGLQWSGGANPADPSDRQVYADLALATGFTINQLRESFQVQKLLERDARGGTRYTEIIRSHFGVISPDARLQRPEFLGGGTTMVNVNPVPQTGATGADTSIIATPQGNLAAFGTIAAQNHGFTKSFTEHGVVIGLVSFRADLTYQQGMNRMWSRRGRYDYYWPALSRLGEQAVLNKEIFFTGDNPTLDESVFGYQERYAEYRYKPSQITGQFRSDASEPLDYWHLAQDFAATPVLDGSFIEENPPIERVLAVPTEPHFLLDVHFDMKCARPMPIYGIPGMIDHF